MPHKKHIQIRNLNVPIPSRKYNPGHHLLTVRSICLPFHSLLFLLFKLSQVSILIMSVLLLCPEHGPASPPIRHTCLLLCKPPHFSLSQRTALLPFPWCVPTLETWPPPWLETQPGSPVVYYAAYSLWSLCESYISNTWWMDVWCGEYIKKDKYYVICFFISLLVQLGT